MSDNTTKMSADTPVNSETPIEYALASYIGIRDHLRNFVDRYNRDHASGPNKMPTVVLDDLKYTTLDNSGSLRVWVAWHGATLVAVLSYIVTVSRHYPKDFKIGLHDFFYVLPEYCAGLVPLTMFRRAEADMWRWGIQKLFFVDHVRFQSRAAAFKRMGWKPCEVTYEKDRPI